MAGDLWVERMAAATGATGLAERLGRPGWGPYLLFGAVWTVDVPVLSTIRYLRAGYHPILVNPGVALVPIVLLVALWSVLALRARFEDARTALADCTDGRDVADDGSPLDRLLDAWDRRVDRWVADTDDPEAWRLIPTRLRAALFVVALVVHVAWVFGARGNPEMLLAREGVIVGAAKFGVLIPFFYFPVVVEFVSVVLAVHLLVPSLVRCGGRVDFEDPLGYGGLRPVGDLVEASATGYFVVLVLYAASVAIGTLTDPTIPEPGLVPSALITAGTAGGLVLFFGPMFSLHRFMSQQKEDRLEEIRREASKGGGGDAVFPNLGPEEDDYLDEYTRHYMNLRRVSEMREFPVSYQRLSKVLGVAALPSLTEVVASYLLRLL
ncbi:MAG: hypothetical protein ABEH78_09665 [Haloferacaceae archaeon]